MCAFHRHIYLPGAVPFLTFNVYLLLVCARPKGWCVHSSATFIYLDCDGDGIPDPTCSDTDGNFGVVKSSQHCQSEWPRATCTDKTGKHNILYLLLVLYSRTSLRLTPIEAD